MLGMNVMAILSLAGAKGGDLDIARFLGTNEMIIMGLAVVMLLFGAKKIPEFAKSIGRAKGEFERGKLEVEREMRESRLKDHQSDVETPVQKAAKDLGIDVAGKTDEEIKKEIVEKMSAS